ncbi:hypothetical protein M501DRAFT_1037530 [Patellaria atrata CBS 101060]|uniref:Globin-sensor domain-containing protein n=1 Tax=Patellaria atrata CBS 101060 TaxID=1346257 RepID=A0A9P4SKT7_9PEZI|nr:hypothetical protein M501DRAFT_1037530 [Patellaria atrata CBS 101060]
MFNASRAPMHHIDRKELYTSLEKRLEYLQSFLDFGPDDMAALESGSKYLRTFIPALVNIIYRKLLQYDITARAFSTRSTSYEGPIKQQLDEEAPQILHRKVFLRGYLNALCKDPGSKAFWEYADKVGMMHTGLGRSAPLHIEYVHISATLGLIQDVLNEAILSHPKLAIGRKIAITKALGKVIWIQNDLFAKWYVRDGEEFSDDAVLPEKEKEGFIGGRKIVGEGEIEGEVDRMELEEARNTARSTLYSVGTGGVSDSQFYDIAEGEV